MPPEEMVQMTRTGRCGTGNLRHCDRSCQVRVHEGQRAGQTPGMAGRGCGDVRQATQKQPTPVTLFVGGNTLGCDPEIEESQQRQKPRIERNKGSGQCTIEQARGRLVDPLLVLPIEHQEAVSPLPAAAVTLAAGHDGQSRRIDQSAPARYLEFQLAFQCEHDLVMRVGMTERCIAV